MPVVILRLVYGLYILGIILLVLTIASRMIFAKEKLPWNEYIKRFLIAWIWPLCFFSKSGRRFLIQMVRR